MIGILRWLVEVGRIKIAFEVSSLSSYLVYPRTEHFVQALHIFKYLDIHKKNELAKSQKVAYGHDHSKKVAYSHKAISAYYDLPGVIKDRCI